MTDSPLIIGVDIGTTSAKAILFTPQGQVVAQHAMGYPLISPEPAIQEQDPDTILDAVTESIGQIITQSQVPPQTLAGICFSAAMHSLIAVDDRGRPLTRSITWADRRSEPWVDKICQYHQGKEIYHRTGTPIHPMSPLVKLLWLQSEQPEVFQQAAKFISIKEYILHQWFGDYVVDYSIANATGLFNMRTLNWDDGALTVAGITPDRLSRLVPTTHVLTGMDPDCAEVMGIPVGLPVVVGASDGVLANLGVGAIKPGVVAITIGTSGAIRTVIDRPATDPLERLFCYALTENHWVIGGAVNNGGIILRWVRDNLAEAEISVARQLHEDPYELITTIAAKVPPGAEGLIFHPYLAGERSPLWDANARGSFFGLALNHTRGHLVRAVMEGILYNLYVVMRSLEDAVGTINTIRATGGFVRSHLWRQMLADIFNQEVVIPESYESSCLGAAFLGLYALGHLDSLEAAADRFDETYRHQPNPDHVAIYAQVIPLFTRLLEQFKANYADLADLQSRIGQG